MLNIFENMHVDELTVAHFADRRTLITGGADNVSFLEMKLSTILRTPLICDICLGRLCLEH